MNIGQVSESSGVSQRMVRHYEKIGLIPAPARRKSGYRVYEETDVNQLRFIANARDLGFPIEDIRALLGLWQDRNRSSREVKTIAMARAKEIGQKIAALEAIRTTLMDLAVHCRGDSRPDCPIIEKLAE